MEKNTNEAGNEIECILQVNDSMCSFVLKT